MVSSLSGHLGSGVGGICWLLWVCHGQLWRKLWESDRFMFCHAGGIACRLG
jgi:hypothetical protein